MKNHELEKFIDILGISDYPINEDKVISFFNKKYREISAKKSRTNKEDNEKSELLYKLDQACQALKKFISDNGEISSLGSQEQEPVVDINKKKYEKINYLIEKFVNDSDMFLDLQKYEKALDVLDLLEKEIKSQGLDDIFKDQIFQLKILAQKDKIKRLEDKENQRSKQQSNNNYSNEQKQSKNNSHDDLNEKVEKAVLFKVEAAFHEINSYLNTNSADCFEKSDIVLENLKKQMESDISKKDGSYIFFYQPDIQRRVIEQKNSIIQKENDYYKSFYTKGIAFENAEMYKEAEESYLKFKNKFPNNLESCFGLSSVYLKTNRLDDSINLLKKLIIENLSLSDKDKSELYYRTTLAYEKKYNFNQDIENLYSSIKANNEACKFYDTNEYKDKKYELENLFIKHLDGEYIIIFKKINNLLSNSNFENARKVLDSFIYDLKNSTRNSKDLENDYYKLRNSNSSKQDNRLYDNLPSFDELYKTILEEEKSFIKIKCNFLLQESMKILEAKKYKETLDSLNKILEYFKNDFNLNLDEYCNKNGLEYLLKDKKELESLCIFEQQIDNAKIALKNGEETFLAHDIVMKANAVCIQEIKDKKVSQDFYNKNIKITFDKIMDDIETYNKDKVESLINKTFEEIKSMIEKDLFDTSEKKLKELETYIGINYKKLYDSIEDKIKDKYSDITRQKNDFINNKIYKDKIHELEQLKHDVQEDVTNNKKIYLQEISDFEQHLKSLIINPSKLKSETDTFIKEIKASLIKDYDNSILEIKKLFINNVELEVFKLFQDYLLNLMKNYYQNKNNLTISMDISSLSKDSLNREGNILEGVLLGLPGIFDSSIILKTLKVQKDEEPIRVSGQVNIVKVIEQIDKLFIETNLSDDFAATSVIVNDSSIIFDKDEMKNNLPPITDKHFLFDDYTSYFKLIINTDIKSFKLSKDNEKTLLDNYLLMQEQKKYLPIPLQNREAILIYSKKINNDLPLEFNILIIPNQTGSFINIGGYLIFNPIYFSDSEKYLEIIDKSIEQYETSFINSLENGSIKEEFPHHEVIKEKKDSLKKKLISEFFKNSYYNSSNIKRFTYNKETENIVNLLINNIIKPAVQENINSLIVRTKFEPMF